MAFRRHRRHTLPTRLAAGALIYLGSLLLGLAAGTTTQAKQDDLA